MAFSLSGGAQGAGMGATVGGPWGALAGGLLGGFFGGGGDPTKKYMKNYNKYVLPQLERIQNQQSFRNNAMFDLYNRGGNEAYSLLNSLGTGRFGLSDAQSPELQALQGQIGQFQDWLASGTPEQRLQAQQGLARYDDLSRIQAQGGTDLQGFLTNHPLYQALQNVGNDALNSQYTAAFGGMAPSSFLGKQKSLMGSQNLLNTFGSVADVLGQTAGMGINATTANVNANSNLAQNVLSGVATGGQQAMAGGIQADQNNTANMWNGFNNLANYFDPLNQQGRDYASAWLANQQGILNGGMNAPNAGPQQPSMMDRFRSIFS